MTQGPNAVVGRRTSSRRRKSPEERKSGLPRLRRISPHVFWALPLLFLAVAYLVPLIRMVVVSLTTPSPHTYVEVLTTGGLYLHSLIVTLEISLIVMGASLLLGFPYAYVMALGGKALRGVLTVLVLLPFLTSLLVRTFAWQVILSNDGVINSILRDLGIIDSPIRLMNNTTGTVIGMTHILLPYMVLPTFAVMQRIPRDLVPAALGLGASRTKAFWKVYLPQTVPGVAAGSVLVFVLSLGFYITPALLGGARDQMLGQLIANEVAPLLRFGIASALGVLLLVATLVVLAVGAKFTPVSTILGVEDDK